jgi:sugar O-acyltransferase (sialic acid O-acetyltransferase NeuD family)
MPERFLIWGAGGHGRVLADLIRARGDRVTGFLDRRPFDRLTLADGKAVPVLAETEIGSGPLPLESTAVALGIGDNEARWSCFERIPAGACPAVVHPRAVVAPDVHLGEGTAVLAGAVLNVGAEVGRAVIVNTGAIVEHDCRIGDGAHLSPGAIVCGGSEIGPRAWVGAGATVIPSIRIGAGAMVGAGSTVIRDVPPGARVAGNPARALANQDAR